MATAAKGLRAAAQNTAAATAEERDSLIAVAAMSFRISPEPTAEAVISAVAAAARHGVPEESREARLQELLRISQTGLIDMWQRARANKTLYPGPTAGCELLPERSQKGPPAKTTWDELMGLTDTVVDWMAQVGLVWGVALWEGEGGGRGGGGPRRTCLGRGAAGAPALPLPLPGTAVLRLSHVHAASAAYALCAWARHSTACPSSSAAPVVTAPRGVMRPTALEMTLLPVSRTNPLVLNALHFTALVRHIALCQGLVSGERVCHEDTGLVACVARANLQPNRPYTFVGDKVSLELPSDWYTREAGLQEGTVFDVRLLQWAVCVCSAVALGGGRLTSSCHGQEGGGMQMIFFCIFFASVLPSVFLFPGFLVCVMERLLQLPPLLRTKLLQRQRPRCCGFGRGVCGCCQGVW